MHCKHFNIALVIAFIRLMQSSHRTCSFVEITSSSIRQPPLLRFVRSTTPGVSRLVVSCYGFGVQVPDRAVLLMLYFSIFNDIMFMHIIFRFILFWDSWSRDSGQYSSSTSCDCPSASASQPENKRFTLEPSQSPWHIPQPKPAPNPVC